MSGFCTCSCACFLLVTASVQVLFSELFCTPPSLRNLSIATIKFYYFPSESDVLLQRSTLTMYKIYNELLGKRRADFIFHLSESCDGTELRYVRDVLYTVMKRRTGSNQLGPLVERKSGENLKEKMVNDI